MGVTDQHRHWLSCLARVPLKPRAHALAVTLAALTPEPQAWQVKSYLELLAVLGSRNSGVSIPRGHNILWLAAPELEDAGLIERHRQENRHGHQFGSETPYRWRCLIDMQAPLPPWPNAAESTIAFALGWGVELGPLATALRARLDAAADERGRLHVTVAELVEVSRMSDKTVEKHLLAQTRRSAGIKTSLVGPSRPRTYAIELAVPRMPARPGRPALPRRLPAGIDTAPASVATPIPANRRSRGYDLADLIELLSALPGSELLREAINNCEAHRTGRYTPTEQVAEFVEPLLQLWDGPVGTHWPDFITERLLPAMIDKSERELIVHPSRYIESVCRNELRIDPSIDIFSPAAATTAEPNEIELDIADTDSAGWEEDEWEPVEGWSPFDPGVAEEDIPPFSS